MWSQPMAVSKRLTWHPGGDLVQGCGRLTANQSG